MGDVTFRVDLARAAREASISEARVRVGRVFVRRVREEEVDRVRMNC